MGIAIAAAVAYGYSNIFITSPSPENLNTVFDFVFKGFDVLKYKDHLDYEAIQSTNPDFNKAIVRINIFRDHRQTIQYIDPADSDRLLHIPVFLMQSGTPLLSSFLILCQLLLCPFPEYMVSSV